MSGLQDCLLSSKIIIKNCHQKLSSKIVEVVEVLEIEVKN